MNEKVITLYPSNWLYNAGVVGLIRVLEKASIKISGIARDDGSADINLSEFSKTRKIENITQKIPLLGWLW